MKKLTLICVFALFGLLRISGISAQSIPTDTLRSYRIDGQPIPHFTGKELVGKTIKQYNISYATATDGNRVTETHLITTTTQPTSKATLQPHYLIKTKDKSHELTKEEFQKIKPYEIKSIDVLKAGSSAVKERGLKDDGRGYLIITLKE